MGSFFYTGDSAFSFLPASAPCNRQGDSSRGLSSRGSARGAAPCLLQEIYREVRLDFILHASLLFPVSELDTGVLAFTRSSVNRTVLLWRSGAFLSLTHFSLYEAKTQTRSSLKNKERAYLKLGKSDPPQACSLTDTAVTRGGGLVPAGSRAPPVPTAPGPRQDATRPPGLSRWPGRRPETGDPKTATQEIQRRFSSGLLPCRRSTLSHGLGGHGLGGHGLGATPLRTGSFSSTSRIRPRIRPGIPALVSDVRLEAVVAGWGGIPQSRVHLSL